MQKETIYCDICEKEYVYEDMRKVVPVEGLAYYICPSNHKTRVKDLCLNLNNK